MNPPPSISAPSRVEPAAPKSVALSSVIVDEASRPLASNAHADASAIESGASLHSRRIMGRV